MSTAGGVPEAVNVGAPVGALPQLPSSMCRVPAPIGVAAGLAVLASVCTLASAVTLTV